MSTVVMSLALLVVIAASLALGVALGYAAILGILSYFSSKSVAAKPAATLAVNAGPTGD